MHSRVPSRRLLKNFAARQDPRRNGERWFMDNWNRQVEKWKRWTEAKGMAGEFEYWGEHELLTRLSLEEHRGCFFFWFHQELFGNRWFQERLDEAVTGPRYTLDLNVDLPIARLFDGLGRTTTFFERLDALMHTLDRKSLEWEDARN